MNSSHSKNSKHYPHPVLIIQWYERVLAELDNFSEKELDRYLSKMDNMEQVKMPDVDIVFTDGVLEEIEQRLKENTDG